MAEKYEPSTYGERIADVYDDHPNMPETEGCVEFLAGVAGTRRVLELGIGTGRVAIPLAARGLKVAGIDASPAMVGKMRAKPGGDPIQVEIGNFADVKINGRFSLIYIVFNTLFALESQEEQIRCFQRVARHLSDDGVFVIEAFYPDHSYFARGQRVGVSRIGLDSVFLETSTHDKTGQRTKAAHVVISESGIKVYPIQIRYAYPPELDLMARLGGMRLKARYANWDRSPFGPNSEKHISVYELVPAAPEPAPKAAKKTLNSHRVKGA
jgi:SAM-dependent methyltransferase